MGGTERELNQEHQALRRTLSERHARVVRMDRDDLEFDAEYEQLVAEAARLIDFENQLPARLAEPKRERSEQFVRWSWRAEAAVSAVLIAAVFLLENTAWWLVVLVPHLLATLVGCTIKVTATRHATQAKVAAALHALCLLAALVSLGVLSAWFIIVILAGWFVIGVASDGTEAAKGRTL
ncbi:hypothetical protein OG592_41885 (plasmid) [Streptomyces avidinii]|uniref:hypothetical protein n=1 Tax=Streptomyces avidinii TaxID=1895 RepID=UPI002F9074A1|nr:hypothetical protein OG592_41885 [Streptomyces avidinii]